MTHALSSATDTPSKQFLNPNAQPLPTPTRTFDLVLGDAVFGESIDERPEPISEPAEAAKPGEADEADRESDAVDDDAADKPDVSDRENPDATAVEGDELLAADEQVEFVEAGQARDTVGVRATREGNVSARGIRAELTHAASVDVASLNAGELASRSSKTLTPEADGPRFRPNAGGEAPTKDASAAKPEAPTPQAAKTAQPGSATTNSVSPAAAGPPPAAAPDTAAVANQSVAAAASTSAAKPATTQAPAVAGVSPSVAASAQQARATSTVAVRGAEGSKQSGVQAKAAARQPGGAPRGADRPAMATLQRGLASVLKAGGGTVTLKLTPEALGEVKVELNLKNGAANARFEASTESARRLLTENMSTLREALEAKGVRVERMSVEMRSAETPPEAAKGERPGTDAGRAHQGQSLDDNSRGAGSETGSDGRTAEDHAARQQSRPRSGQPGAEHPDNTNEHAEPGTDEQARTPDDAESWLGLDTIA